MDGVFAGRQSGCDLSLVAGDVAPVAGVHAEEDEVPLCIGMLGIDGKRLGEVGGRVLETLQGGECRAMIDEGICRTRLARNCLFKREKRFLMPAQFLKNAAAIVPVT